MTPLGPASNSYFSQGLKLHYADWGNQDKPPLVLVHGGRDHCRNWDWVAEALRDDWHIIAPDLRGHGDSAWVNDSNYTMTGFVYDLAQLIDQLELAPVTIVAHSLGGNISLRYTGLYPEKVRRLVAIEGMGPSPEVIAEMKKQSFAEMMREWIERRQGYAGMAPRRYPDFQAALDRMREENPHLSPEQARHLTTHAVIRNEDGSYSWKFDPNIRNWFPVDFPRDEIHNLFGAITCPVLHCYGDDSWASNPAKDGRIKYFGDNAKVMSFAKAGHWLHHDQFDAFMAALRDFL